MASGAITSWQIDGETMETVTDFILGGSQITADGDCSHEIKRHLLLGRKVMTNLERILKSRDITLPTKFSLFKSMAFPVVMYECESRTIKKAERRRTDAFELWCWRRLLRVPWTARRSNQSLVKEISPEYSLEGLMLKLKRQYLVTWCKELTHLKRPWCWERWKEEGEGDDRGWDGWMSSPIRWTWVWVNSRSWWWTGKSGVLPSMGLQRVRHDWVTELNWTDQIASLKFKKSSHFYKRCMNVPFPHIPVLSGWCSIKTVPVWWIKVILCNFVIFIFLLLSDLTIFFFVWGPPRLALPSSHSLCPFFCWTVSILTVCKCVWCVFLLTLFLYYFCN